MIALRERLGRAFEPTRRHTLLGRSFVVLRGLDDPIDMSDIGPINWCSVRGFQYGSMIAVTS